MKITELLDINSIDLNPQISNKEEAIDHLVNLLDQSGKLNDKEIYKESVLNREKQSTTGIGDGVAIPHGQSEGVKTAGLSAMVVKEGLDFKSLDGQPTYLFFMIGAPKDSEGAHLQALAQLSTLLMEEDFRNALINASSKEEFLQLIDAKENKKEEAKAVEEEKTEEKASEGSQNEEPEKTVIYYVTDEVQQSQYINMFREAGKDAVLLKHVIDSQFISHLEQQDQTIQFKRIDADLTEELREDGEADETTVKTLTEVFRKNLGKDKLEVKVEKLKNEGTAAMITLPEESRRMQDMMKMYNMYGMDPNMFGGQEVLVLNANHPLVRFIAENQGSEYVPVICEQLYDLAMMSHKQLSPEEMTKFVKRSNDILMVLTK